MTISDYIQQISTEVFPGDQYLYKSKYDANIVLDNAASPAIVALFPDQFSFNISALSGNIADGYSLFIQFIEHLDNISEQVDYYNPAIERQKLRAAEFLVQLSGDDNFVDLINPINAVPVVEAYDGNWFGVEISIRNLTTIMPLSICYPINP